MIYEFDPQIYPRKLWVSINPNREELVAVFGESEDIDFPEYADAVTTSLNKIEGHVGGVLIMIANRKAITYDIVTHESIHAAWDILEYIGDLQTHERQEPLAYLAGWIAKCIEKAKRGKGIALIIHKDEKE